MTALIVRKIRGPKFNWIVTLQMKNRETGHQLLFLSPNRTLVYKTLFQVLMLAAQGLHQPLLPVLGLLLPALLLPVSMPPLPVSMPLLPVLLLPVSMLLDPVLVLPDQVFHFNSMERIKVHINIYSCCSIIL